MATVVRLRAVMGLDDSALDEGLRGAEQKIASAGQKLAGVGQKLTLGVTAPLLGMGAAALNAATDFNASMANVATLIPDNVERINELKNTVREMAVAVGADSRELADGLYETISAFGDTADTAKILEINAKAAAAGLATTADAVNLTSAVTRGYGEVSAEAVQRVADLAFMTTNLGQTNFPELASSMGRVVPLAATLGVSMEELFGTMATATGVTGSAAEVATQLRGILQGLMAPTDAMAALIKTLGYESGQAMLQQRGLKDTIATIVQTAQMSNLPLQEFLSSIEGQTLALSLAGPQADAFTERLEAMNNVAGAADDAFRQQTEGVNKAGFAWKQFKAELGVTVQMLGDELAPVALDILRLLKPVGSGAVDAAQGFSTLDTTTKRVILGLLGLAAATGPVLMVVGQVMAALPALKSAWAAVAGVMSGPVGWAILAVVAAVTALTVAWQTNLGGIQQHTQAFVAWITPYLAAAWGQIRATAVAAWTAIRDFVAEVWGPILTIITTELAALRAVWGPLLVGLVDVWRDLWGDLATIVEGAWYLIRGIVKVAWGLLAGIIVTGLKLLSGDWRGAWEAHQKYTRVVWDGIADIVRGALTLIAGIVGGAARLLYNAARALLLGLVNGIRNGLTFVKDMAMNIGRTLLAGVKESLGIHSPSREMAKVGDNAVLGIRLSLEKGRKSVGKAAGNLGKEAARKAKQALEAEKRAMQRQAEAFARELATARGKLAAAVAGRDDTDVDLAERFAKIAPARRAELAAILQRTEAVKAERQAQDEFTHALGRLHAQIAYLQGDELALLRFDNPGETEARLRQFTAAQKTIDGLTDSQRRNAEAAEEMARRQAEAAQSVFDSIAAIHQANQKDVAASVAPTTGPDVNTEAAERLKDGFRELAYQAALASASTDEERRALELLGPAAFEAGGEVRALAFLLAGQQLAAERVATANLTAKETQDALNTALKDAQLHHLAVTAATDAERVAIEVLRKPLAELTAEQRKQVDAIAAAAKATKDHEAAQQAAKTAADQQDRATEALRGHLADLRDEYSGLTGTLDVAGATLRRLGIDTATLTAEQRELLTQIVATQAGIDATARRQDEIRSLGDGIRNTFRDVFMDLKGGFSGLFGGILSGFQKLLQRMAAEYLASYIARLFLSGLSNAFGFDMPAGDFGGFRAAGGPVGAGRAYVVGERGPELFVPQSRGTIVPNHALAGAGGGGGVTVYMNVYTNDASSFRRSEGQITGDLARRINRARLRDD